MSSCSCLQWERRVESKGVEQGVTKGLVKLYRARFGVLPPAITAALDVMHDPDTLDRWLDLFVVKSAEEIAAALEPAAVCGS